MWFLISVFIVLSFIVYKYLHSGIHVIKLRNSELLLHVDELNKQLDVLNEKENKAIREADIATKAKSKLMSSLSHDIRTPMNGIIGMATLLTGTELNTEQSEYAVTVLDCSKALLHNVNEILINDMLEFSKIDADGAEVSSNNFDLRNSIEEVIDMFAGKAAEKGIDLLYQIENNIPLQITGDYKKLQQVLINLTENAVKFTTKGEVVITVKLLENIGSQLQLCFTVRDSGEGIINDKLEHIFNPLLPDSYSTKSKQPGKGFGLVICKKLIEKMGGQIWVESEPGKGSDFVFNIPVGISGKVLPDFTKNKMLGFEGKQILIVDDNPVSLSILNAQIEELKLLPVLASSGRHALEILSQFSVDLIITDLVMPAMDGIELSKSIKAHYPKIPVILLNAVNDERYKQYADIFSGVIHKPVKQQHLFDTILAEFRHQSKSNGGANQIPDNFSEKYPLRILVAEDNPVNQKWIDKILSKIGYKCEIAANGKIVLETVSHDHYDLILMDVQMPEMDGLEATRMIRLCLETQPIIVAMTANALQGDREACLESGMNDYISKPVELNILLNTLEKWALFIKEKKQLTV